MYTLLKIISHEFGHFKIKPNLIFCILHSILNSNICAGECYFYANKITIVLMFNKLVSCPMMF